MSDRLMECDNEIEGRLIEVTFNSRYMWESIYEEFMSHHLMECDH